MKELTENLGKSLKANGHKNTKITTRDIYSVHTLDNLIDHPKFFEKYPSLKNTEIILANFKTDAKR